MKTNSTIHRILGQVVAWAVLVLVLALLTTQPGHPVLAQEGSEPEATATETLTPMPPDTPTSEATATSLPAETPTLSLTSEATPTSEIPSESTETPTPIPTETPEVTITPPNPDLNGDGEINILDLTLLASYYGTNDPLADLNADGSVDILDLAIVANSYDQSKPGLEPPLSIETPIPLPTDTLVPQSTNNIIVPDEVFLSQKMAGTIEIQTFLEQRQSPLANYRRELLNIEFSGTDIILMTSVHEDWHINPEILLVQECINSFRV